MSVFKATLIDHNGNWVLTMALPRRQSDVRLPEVTRRIWEPMESWDVPSFHERIFRLEFTRNDFGVYVEVTP